MRVILLGASNVTLAFPRLWYGLRRAFAEPIEMFAAYGHGRSFGTWSRVGLRELPGIATCRLWEDLAAQPPSRELPRAIITDIGNDLLYGADPDQIVEWVAVCLDRLSALSARIVMTQLPLASAAKLGRARFELFRSVLFPKSVIQFDDLQESVMQLNQRLMELGRLHKTLTPALRGNWYGFDPIHIRRRHRDLAWQELLSAWFEDPTAVSFRSPGLAETLRLWRQRPFKRRWCGREQCFAQPTLSDPDGGKLWLY